MGSGMGTGMESGDGDGIVIPGPYPTRCHPYIGGADIMFDGVVGGASQGRASANGGDHVNLSLVRVRRGWYVVDIVA